MNPRAPCSVTLSTWFHDRQFQRFKKAFSPKYREIYFCFQWLVNENHPWRTRKGECCRIPLAVRTKFMCSREHGNSTIAHFSSEWETSILQDNLCSYILSLPSTKVTHSLDWSTHIVPPTAWGGLLTLASKKKSEIFLLLLLLHITSIEASKENDGGSV